ncbi:ABC transporter ATP-binding protein [Acidothermaceae bacterium B102]|nr:ABC transporter ATP-binding protein [Acidothermaceae bacterium B102]
MTTVPVRASSWATMKRGIAMSPEFRRGLGLTLSLTLVATAGRVVVPIAIQQIIDKGLPPGGKPDLPLIRNAVIVAAAAVLLTAVSASWMNVRLYRSTESGLATLRLKAFRHIHDLSMLHQASERRGSLVSRVTSDVDQISTFMQWGGVLLVVSAAQLVVATVIMAYYSWQLTLLVYVCFVPLVLLVRHLQPGIRAAYGRVRERVGDVLGAVSESVVGASVIKAYGSEARTATRVDDAIDEHVNAAIKAQIMTASTFTTGELVSSLANAAIVIVGVELGLHGQLTAGKLVAFLFLVTLFVSPVQAATETLNDAQNAVAGWGRVIEILDTPTDVADPGVDGRDLPAGALDVAFDHVHFAYPGGPEVLSDVDLRIAARTRVAIVGETGSGKTTFAKLLTRLMDPVSGAVLLGGVPLRNVRFASLRRRVVMVPQDGFLFDTTIGANVRYGRPGATDADLLRAFDELSLTDWLEGLDAGLDTRVGERGGSLSAGERQLVALARAYLADPDLLVLDEATSAVDPATEVRLSRALEGLTNGRTTITIAHRLSTAEVADEVIVVDAGRVVQRGSHAELVAVPGRYAELHRSWSANKGTPV